VGNKRQGLSGSGGGGRWKEMEGGRRWRCVVTRRREVEVECAPAMTFWQGGC